MEGKKKEIEKVKKEKEAEERTDIPEELEELFNFIPNDKKKDAIKIISSLTIKTSSAFSGPLPPPTILNEYNEIIDNGAERIMKMAENQSKHRIELEKHAITEELKQSKKGQTFGFILALIGLGMAFILAIMGHDTVAGIFGTTTIVGLVTVFVIGKKKQDTE